MLRHLSALVPGETQYYPFVLPLNVSVAQEAVPLYRFLPNF